MHENSDSDSDSDSDFVFVELEQAQTAMEAAQRYELASRCKDVSSLRLNPTQLNNLNLSYIEMLRKNEHYRIEEGFVKTLGKYSIHTAYKKMTDANNFFVVFQVTRDSKKKDENKNLPFINDVIRVFLKENPQENITLLMPMAQCRAQLGIKNKHYVLVEVIIHGSNKKIFIHNSQSEASIRGYRNCLKFNDLNDFKFIKHHTYSQQKDDFSCGLFFYRYIQSILESGNAQQLKAINKVSLADPCLNLDELIRHNLRQITPRQPRKIASSENLPWQTKELAKFRAVDYAANLNLDFPEDEENDSSFNDALATANLMTYSPKPVFFARSINELPSKSSGGIEKKTINGR